MGSWQTLPERAGRAGRGPCILGGILRTHPGMSSDRAERMGRTRPSAPSAPNEAKKKIRWSAAWQEARTLIWARRGRLTLGLLLMLVSRAAGMVLPALSKYFVDD